MWFGDRKNYDEFQAKVANEKGVYRGLTNYNYLLQMYCLVSMAPSSHMGRHHQAKHTRWKV